MIKISYKDKDLQELENHLYNLPVYLSGDFYPSFRLVCPARKQKNLVKKCAEWVQKMFFLKKEVIVAFAVFGNKRKNGEYYDGNPSVILLSNKLEDEELVRVFLHEIAHHLQAEKILSDGYKIGEKFFNFEDIADKFALFGLATIKEHTILVKKRRENGMEGI